MTKVKELLNPRINGHNEHILSVPWRDLSCENVPYSLPFSNGPARGIRSKKIVIRSNSLGYPFEKIVIRSNGLGYPFGKEFVDRSSD